ncbi:unnamed protein product [Brachionus calyciflorus]|uniref:Uncharacterized protein n=1 Tax=Brachionus calyciflorus TaxID=104777 RepID=A0A814BNC3_9BILA|nr:unnamed protein product [Brachionus calyciflorus]
MPSMEADRQAIICFKKLTMPNYPPEPDSLSKISLPEFSTKCLQQTLKSFYKHSLDHFDKLKEFFKYLEETWVGREETKKTGRGRPTDSVVKFEALVSEILNLIEKIHLDNKDPNICILGGFNTDLERNSNFTEIFNLFVVCKSLIVADYLFTQKKDFTYKQNRIIKNDKDKTEILRSVTSRIDHVLVNENFSKKVEQVNILNEQDHQSNTGDNLAIKIDLKKLNINIELKQKLKTNTTLTYVRSQPNVNKLAKHLKNEQNLTDVLIGQIKSGIVYQREKSEIKKDNEILSLFSIYNKEK